MSAKWLDVISESKVELNTLPSCLALCDLQSDGYYKLIAVEIPADLSSKSKLVVYKGTTTIGEQELPAGIPSSIQSFYIDEQEPKIPILAVAIGPSVLFYRNLKPYYKFTLPSLIVEPLEKDVWRKLPNERPEKQETLIESLKAINISQLTWLSQKLLYIPTSERASYIKKYGDVELQKLSVITAMTTLQRVSSDSKPPSCLVLATEDGEIIIIDTQAFIVIYKAKVCSFQVTPNLISASGQFDTDFRIIIATREGSLCLLRKMWLEGKQILKLEHSIISLALLPIDQTIITICMKSNLTCYSKKGKKLWSVALNSAPRCMVPIPLAHLGITLLSVALKGGCVQFYSQKHLVDEFTVEDTVSAMIFGRLGQEEHVLTMITEDCRLLVKILKRKSTFNSNDFQKSTPDSSDKTGELKIPKKNSIFIEQTLREKENNKAIYNNFQTDLWIWRLTAARATIEAINSAESTISGDVRHAPIKLAAEICGVGPQFSLFLTIENMSTRVEATNLSVLLHANSKHYTLPKPMAKLPVLIPGIPLKINFEIISVLDSNDGLPPSDLTTENAAIRIIIVKAGQAKPLIAAVVSMPESEAPLEE